MTEGVESAVGLSYINPIPDVPHVPLFRLSNMGRKTAKATRKFAASGQLKKTIQARRKHQDIKRKVEKRKGAKDLKRPEVDQDDVDALEMDETQQT